MDVQVVVVLDRALRDAGVPIDGVSVGDPANRGTWRACYTAAATAAQRAQGDALLATIDPQDGTTIAAIKTDQATVDENANVLRALGQGLWECIPAPTMTKAQLLARIIVIYKGLLT